MPHPDRALRTDHLRDRLQCGHGKRGCANGGFHAADGVPAVHALPSTVGSRRRFRCTVLPQAVPAGCRTKVHAYLAAASLASIA